MPLALDCTHNLAGHLVGLQHHGIMEIAFQQVGIDKAGTNVSETDF